MQTLKLYALYIRDLDIQRIQVENERIKGGEEFDHSGYRNPAIEL